MKKILSVVILFCLLSSFVPFSLFVNAEVSSHSTNVFLDDDTIDAFVNLLYDSGSTAADEMKAVLKGEKEGTYENFCDMYEKIYNIYDLTVGNDVVVTMAKNTVLDISKCANLISGILTMSQEIKNFETDNNAMKKTIDSFQILQGLMTMFNCGQYFPSGLSAVLSASEFGLCLASYLQEQYFKEAEALYGYELFLAYHSGGELPIRQAHENWINFKISKKEADNIYAQLYLKYYTRRMMQRLGNVGSQASFQTLNGHSYILFDAPASWNVASAHCESLGGHLVTITSHQEQAFVESLIKAGSKNNYWLGGCRNEDGVLEWTTGESMTYSNWAMVQPDNSYNKENCMMMYRVPDIWPTRNLPGKWNDVSETGEVKDNPYFGVENFGFICEWEYIYNNNSEDNDNLDTPNTNNSASGTLSNGLSWEFSDNSLSIRGSATSIPTFKPGEAPWSQYAPQIGCLYLFASEIEKIGAYSFYDLSNVGYINISSDSLSYIGKYAFGKMKSDIDIWFFGSEEQWKDIKIDYGNDPLISSDVFCSKSSSTIWAEHISTPSKDYLDNSFLNEHLLFVKDENAVITIKDNSFSNVAVVNKKLLNAYNFWDVLGDVGEIATLKFDDITINANYYEMYLSDMILALNNEEQASNLEWKVAEIYTNAYGTLKGLLQGSDEWESDVSPSMVKEIEDLLTGKSFELGDKTSKVLEKIFKDLYKNNKKAFASVFEGLSTASTVLDGVFATFDVVNAYLDAYNAFVVSKAFFEVNDEFFDVCITAGKRLSATSEYRQYGKWFLNAVYEAKKSEIGNLSIIFDAALQLKKSETAIVYNHFIQKIIQQAVYPTVAKLLGLPSAGQFSIATLAYNFAYGVLDTIFSASKASAQYKIINYITPVEQQLSYIVDAQKNNLLSSQSESSAVSYDMAYRLLRHTNMYLYDATYKHASIKNNTSDMTYATIGKNIWNRTLCHSGDYGNKYNIFSARCPVDVYVYDSNGMLITSIVNEKIEEYDDRITIMSNNGHKFLAYPSEEKFTFVIKAREEGKMDYSFGTLIGSQIEAEYASYNINLTTEQEFFVTIPVSDNNNENGFKLTTDETQIAFDYNSTASCESHCYGEWNINPEIKSRICETCGHTEYVAVCSHNFETVEIYSIIPTCNTNGQTIFVCACCGIKMSDGTEKLASHAWDEGNVTKHPSTTDVGEKTYTCTDCGATKTEEIPKTPITHTPSDSPENNTNTNKPLSSVAYKKPIIAIVSIIGVVLLAATIFVVIKKKHE